MGRVRDILMRGERGHYFLRRFAGFAPRPSDKGSVAVKEGREKRKSGEVVRDTTLGRGKEIMFLALKVPRQYPFVLLVQVMQMNGFLYDVGRAAL
jgi:hypothetical protein